MSNKPTRLAVIKAALSACKAGSKSSKVPWPKLSERMCAIGRVEGAEGLRLASFGETFGSILDKPEAMIRALDAEWMELFNKVLRGVANPETKLKRLNCATCDKADFPALLTVIFALAHGAPDTMWSARGGEADEVLVGLIHPMEGDSYPPTTAAHRAIAERTWYRPELVMLVTSLWPNELDMTYYEATLRHILSAGIPNFPGDIEVGNLAFFVGESDKPKS